MERIAITTESEANILITTKENELHELKAALDNASRKIIELEKSNAKKFAGPPKLKRLQEALAKANNEKRKLIKEINEMKAKENSCCQELERLKSRQSQNLRRPSYQDVVKERDDLKKVLSEKDNEHQLLREKLKTLEKDQKKFKESIDERSNYVAEIESHKNRLEEYSKALEKENSELRVSTTKIRYDNVLAHSFSGLKG